MKNASTALKNLLATKQFEKADLWTITLAGGTPVRWSAADIELSYGGFPFILGPLIDRGTITDRMGLEVSTLNVTLSARDDTTINGVPLIQFIKNRGLDGANVKLERVFMPEWTDPITGGVIRFAGKVTSVGNIKGSSATLTVSSWAILLNVNYPPDVYQSGCMWTVYDSGCQLLETAFQGNFTCAAGSTTTSVNSTATGGANYTQGRVQFLTGPNAGLKRVIKQASGTTWSLMPPLPVAPGAGDTFKASFGCDLTPGTCQTRFNNKINFKGTPYVPVPETVV